MSSLQDRLDRETEVLKLEAGESVVGRLVELTLRDSDYGDPYPLVVLETSDGREVAVHGYHSVLRNRLLELDPRTGDELGIKCLGPRTSKAGTKYTDYRVVIDRADRPDEQVDPDDDAQVDPDPDEPKAEDDDEPEAPVPVLDLAALKATQVPAGFDDEEPF